MTKEVDTLLILSPRGTLFDFFESWLDGSVQNCDEYVVFRQDRRSGAGGGTVMVVIQSTDRCRRRTDLEHSLALREYVKFGFGPRTFLLAGVLPAFPPF